MGAGPGWLVAVDTGGTFTDGVAVGPDGGRRRVKVLSAARLRAQVDAPRERPGAAPAAEVIEASIPGSADQPPGAFDGWRVGGRTVRRSEPRGAGGRWTLSLRAETGDGAGGAEAFAPGSLVDLDSPEPAPVMAARLLTRTPMGAALPPMRMHLATTRGTNALLERRVDRVVAVTNAGLADALEIGDQRRRELYSLVAEREAPLHAATLEVPLRQGPTGDVEQEMDGPAWEAFERASQRLAQAGMQGAAVVLLHAWRNGEPEARLAARLRRCGLHVVASSEVSGVEGWLERSAATVVDAALAGPVAGFVADNRRALLEGSELLVLTSAGSLETAAAYRPKDSLLSGPAGGAAAVAALAARHGIREALGLDMGGTSTDACRVAGRVRIRGTTAVAGVAIASPSVAVESVAAGGGSICLLRDGRPVVGPESAGGHPGPACYGRGGPLTVTDCNLLLGRSDPSAFALPVRTEAARMAALAATGEDELQPERLAATLEGFLEVADAAIAEALKAISAREGFDPATHALVAFGGAGGQHACRVAERLGIRRILHPPDAGILSALGVAAAALERARSEGCAEPLDARSLQATHDRALASLRAGGAPWPVRTAEASLRWQGQSACVDVALDAAALAAPAPAWPALAAEAAGEAAALYRRTFGAEPPARAMELVSLRVVVGVAGAPLPAPSAAEPEQGSADAAQAAGTAEAPRLQRMRSNGAWRNAPLLRRGTLAAGAGFDGPAIVADATGTLVVDAGWRAEVLADGCVRLTRDAAPAAPAAPVAHAPADAPTAPEPVGSAAAAEVAAARLAGVAVQMGEQLRRTAVSVNVRDRLDFSCGILDGAGRLATNAPHVPVHLGALGPCVQALSRGRTWRPGDVVATNHPAFGGSHLPDVTVVAPVFEPGRRDGAPLAFVAARAHHAEIGGVRPGSMAPRAASLEEEGVVIPPCLVAEGGRAIPEGITALLTGARWPTRALQDNLADLAAAVASLRRGVEELERVCAEWGAPQLQRHLDGLRARAASGARRAIVAAFRLGEVRSATERMDDGWPIQVRMERRGERLVVDLGGSGGVHAAPFNAPFAVTRSAVMYAMRLLLGAVDGHLARDVPLNDGLLEPVDLTVPPGFLAPPFPPAAPASSLPPVAAGNTETSQRVVDCLLRALGLAACSQGTMNNLLFGGPDWGYYETIGGGAGAAPGRPGASAIHSHMTNTRISDPEILERRVPVRLERFSRRPGSGGAGAAAGGEGAVRTLRFLAPAQVSFMGERRAHGPGGAAGGGDGRPGAQWLQREAGGRDALPGTFQVDVQAGDRISIETPGGGGWGPPPAPG